MANIGSLTADLTLESASFVRNIEKARRSVGEFGTRTNRAFRSVDRSYRHLERSVARQARQMFSLQGAIATVAGSAGLGLLVRRSLEAADSIAKTADRVGVATSALQELRYAAELAGVQQATLDMALQRFTRRAAEAAQGAGEAVDALAEMGIQLRTTTGAIRPTEALLGDVAAAFARVESPADRVRLAFKLFDSEGAALVNMLSDGQKALAATRKEARDLGLVLEEHLLRRAEDTNDSITALTRSIESRFTRSVLESAESIRQIAQAVTEALPAVSGFFAELVQRAETTAREIRGIAGAVQSVIDFFASPTSVQPVADLEARVRMLNDQIRETQDRLADGGSLGDQALLDQLIRARRQVLDLIAGRTGGGPLELTIDRGRKPDDPATDPDPTGTIDPTGTTEAERRAGRIQSVVDALRFEQEQLARTSRQQEIYSALQRAAVSIESERGQQIAALAGRIYDANQAQEQANDIVSRAAAVYEATRTPLESYRQTIADLNELQQAGAISAETYARAVEHAQGRLEQVADQTDQLEQLGERAFDRIGRSITDAFVRGQGAAVTFASVAQGVVSELMQSFIELAAINPIKNALFGTNLPGLGNIFGSLFGGGGGGVAVAAPSSIGSIGNVGFNPGAFGFEHGGSFRVGGVGGPDSQLVSFRATPGEMVDVRTPGQAAGGGVIVNVNDHRSGDTPPVEVSHGQAADGRRMLEITILDAVQKGIGQGALDRALGTNFGLRRRGRG